MYMYPLLYACTFFRFPVFRLPLVECYTENRRQIFLFFEDFFSRAREIPQKREKNIFISLSSDRSLSRFLFRGAGLLEAFQKCARVLCSLSSSFFRFDGLSRAESVRPRERERERERFKHIVIFKNRTRWLLLVVVGLKIKMSLVDLEHAHHFKFVDEYARIVTEVLEKDA